MSKKLSQQECQLPIRCHEHSSDASHHDLRLHALVYHYRVHRKSQLLTPKSRADVAGSRAFRNATARGDSPLDLTEPHPACH